MRKTLLLALSLLGLFDSIYLWWAYTSPSRPMVCLGSGCDAVRASPFAYPAGIPLPVFGAAMYATLALLIFAQPLVAAAWVRLAGYAVAGIAGLGFVSSLYLTGVEALVLHAWCAWCVVSAITVTFIFVLSLLDVARPAAFPEPPVALATMRKYLALVVGGVILGIPALLLLARSGTPPPPPQTSSEALEEHLVRPDCHMTGNLHATITVVEFGDFECRYCGKAEEIAREIRRRYGDQIRFVFRQFPLERIHAQALKAAEASECAADQGRFWEAVDRIYQGQDDLSEPALARYAGEIGLDVPRFRQCLASGSTLARIRRDIEDARALGVDRTPTFFVGHQRIVGALDPNQFPRLLEQERGTARASLPDPEQTSSRPSSKTSQTNPLSQAPASQAGSTAFSSGGLMGGAGPFGQFQTSETGCSEAEAAKRQPTLIRTSEARQLFEGAPKALFIDVREAKDFQAGHIPEAVNVPVDKIGERLNILPTDRTIILYESGRSSGDICAAGRTAGRVLLSHGYPFGRVKVYQDGLAGWEQAGLPIKH